MHQVLRLRCVRFIVYFTVNILLDKRVEVSLAWAFSMRVSRRSGAIYQNLAHDVGDVFFACIQSLSGSAKLGSHDEERQSWE